MLLIGSASLRHERETMTQNEVKELLKSAMDAYRRYRAKADEADVFRQQLAVKPLSGNGGGGSSSKSNSTEIGYIRLCAIEDKAHELYVEWLERRDTVQGIIARCPIQYGDALLTRRYLNGETFEKAAENMDVSVRYVYKIHKKCIQYLVNIL